MKKIFKWLAILVGIVVVLVALFVSAVVWVLTPERLTPLIERYASDYLTADLTLGRAELTFWHTFPRLNVDIEDLRITSRALADVAPEVREALPANADSLLRVEAFSGGVNIPALMAGKIRLYDIKITRPWVNLVAVNDSVANYYIVPPSDDKDDSPTEIPDIAVNRFVIEGGMPVHYFSLADSLDVGLNISVIDFDGNDNPRYSIDIDADATTRLEPWVSIARLPLTANGAFSWSHKEPTRLGLSNFTLGAGPVVTVTDAEVSFAEPLTVSSLTSRLERVKIADLLPFVPEEYRADLQAIDTDMAIEAEVTFTKPYIPDVNPVPTADIALTLPDCRVKYDGYTLSSFSAEATAHLNGDRLDASSLDIKRLSAKGEGVDLKLDANITSPLSDPRVKGRWSGTVNLARLPKKLVQPMGLAMKGVLKGDFTYDLRQSYLTPGRFHRILLKGEASLTDLDVTQTELGAYLFANRLDLRMGTANKFVRNEFTADSLLTASLRADTFYCALPGMTLAVRSMMVGMGVKNTGHVPGSRAIVPFGGAFKVERLVFNSEEDSMRLSLRDIRCRASLRRFEGREHNPQLTLHLNADAMRFRDPLTRVSLRQTELKASCHFRPKPQMSPRMAAMFDSIQALNPKLRPDSVYRLTMAEMRANRTPRGKRTPSGKETLDYGLDRSTKRWLRWIDFEGHLTSARARLFTPYFPARNALSDIDITINTDSIGIHNTRYRLGHSDFLINGSITNLTPALTSHRESLNIRLNVKSDTIDVNQIAETAFAGAAFADKLARGAVVNLGDTENDELMQKAIEQTASSDSSGPLLVPSNIDATVRITAKNIIYSDLIFNDFAGVAMVYDGALNLHRLSAATDVGSLALSALYTAPTKDDMSFAFGLDVKDLQLDKFMQLIPAVDSLMPLLNSVKGIVNAEVAATTKVDTLMDIDIPSLSAVVKISGDSLVLLDDETFRTISKWLLFKDKQRNMINHMDVQLVVENSTLELFPFMFDIDRYRLGVMGSNDLALNFDYHVSVLKSPLPFKFGINAKGNPDNMKVRVGKARFKENMAVDRIALVDTTRINLINQIENVFRRGVSRSRKPRLNAPRPDGSYRSEPVDGDTISAADSLMFINAGLINR